MRQVVLLGEERPCRIAAVIEKMIVVTIDGVRPDALAATETETIGELFKRGTGSLEGQTIMPCATLPAHTSLFYGVSPHVHGVKANNEYPKLENAVHGDTLFDRAWKKGYETGSYVSWGPLLNIYGDREQLMHAYHHKFYYRVNYQPQDDFYKCYEKHIMGFVDFCRQKKPDLLHLYMEAPDVFGHHTGWMSKEYLHAISVSDRLLGRVLAAVKSLPGYERTNVLVTTDHGGSGKGHTEDSAANRTTWFVVTGDAVKAGKMLGAFSILDLVPTIASLLGIGEATHWEGHALEILK